MSLNIVKDYYRDKVCRGWKQVQKFQLCIHDKRNAKSPVPKAVYEVQLLHRYASLLNQSTNSSLFVYSHQIPILEVLYFPDCDKTFTSSRHTCSPRS